MQKSLQSVIKIQKFYRGHRARKEYQTLLAEKILKEEEERFENERKKVEQGIKEMESIASRERWDCDDICLSTDRRQIMMSNSSTKTKSASKENFPPELSHSKIKKQINFSFIADDKYVSKTSRDRNGSPGGLLTGRSDLTSCTTRRQRDIDNETLPYFCTPLQTKSSSKMSSARRNKKPIMFEFDIYIRAATDIQKVWRGFYFRKKNSNIKTIVKAVKKIQRKYRKYRAEKIKKVKENLKMLHVQQKKITKYLEGYEVCFDKLKKMYPHAKVQSMLKNSKTTLFEYMQGLLRKQKNQEYLSYKKEISTQTQHPSQSLTTASNSYAAGSFLNERKLPNKVQRSLQFQEGNSQNDSWFITSVDNQKSDIYLPTAFENYCCCPKEDTINDLKRELEIMREKIKDQENRHAQEIKTWRSKMKKVKDCYSEYTEKVSQIVDENQTIKSGKGKDTREIMKNLNLKFNSVFMDNDRILTDMSNYDEECSDFGLYTFNR